MYGMTMHQTGAELDTDVHLQIFDQALEIRDRKLIEQERLLATAVVFDELIRLAKELGTLRVSDLEGVRRIIEHGLGRPLPDGSPAEPPPTAPGSGSV
jgi:hypothetical protein